MPDSSPDLGNLVSTHGTSPVFLQRAAVVAVLAFFFFMATLLLFYIQQQFMYFILSTAFLVIHVFTMIGWVIQKRNVVSIYENGIVYRKFASRWDEIKSVSAEPNTGIEIVKLNDESVTIGKATADLGRIGLLIRQNVQK